MQSLLLIVPRAGRQQMQGFSEHTVIPWPGMKRLAGASAIK